MMTQMLRMSGVLSSLEKLGRHVLRSTPLPITAICKSFTLITLTDSDLTHVRHSPHDGKQLDATIITRALEQGYGLSSVLANILVIGGIALLGQVGNFDLSDLARHNRIEHDASLVHDDTKVRDEYAPIAPDSTLVKQFLELAKDGRFMTVEDVARARVWRESQCPVLNQLHAEIARGEMAIAVGLFGQEDPDNDNKQGIPVDTLRVWLGEERLPDGWKPNHIQGLLETIRTSRQINNEMKKIEDEDENKGVLSRQFEAIRKAVSVAFSLLFLPFTWFCQLMNGLNGQRTARKERQE